MHLVKRLVCKELNHRLAAANPCPEWSKRALNVGAAAQRRFSHENPVSDSLLNAAGFSVSGAATPGRKSKDPRRQGFGPVQDLSVVSATRADEVGT